MKPSFNAVCSRACESKFSAFRVIALTVLFGGLVAGSPALAQTDDTAPQDNGMDQATPAMTQPKNGKMMHGPKDMMQHVETRIKTLHDKLKITSDQESKWNDLAQVMRDNENDISQLVQARHKNTESMTAIDDLQSYANITQSHADGLKKMVPVFQALYSDMSDDQKKNADMVFGRFEGHHGEKAHKRHK